MSSVLPSLQALHLHTYKYYMHIYIYTEYREYSVACFCLLSVKVNKDFGSIFSTLLPGTKAKLQPPEGMDVLDGLEVTKEALLHMDFMYNRRDL